MELKEFKNIINSWYLAHRRDLPWRKTFDPYSILVSEIMLQQTQVSRVLNFYDKFLDRYPTFSSLSIADNKTLYGLWNGLGYWKRALNLRKTAEIIQVKYEGVFPNDIDTLKTLPGVGEYTSAALKCFIYNYPVAFVETNIRKVIKHFFFSETDNVSEKEIYKIADLVLDRDNPREWNYALMDYGSSEFRLKKVTQKAKKESFIFSNRYYRGEIIRFITQKGEVSIDDINSLLVEKSGIEINSSRINSILESLINDELIIYKNDRYYI